MAVQVEAVARAEGRQVRRQVAVGRCPVAARITVEIRANGGQIAVIDIDPAQARQIADAIRQIADEIEEAQT
jgi:hypothetical protein